MVLSPLVLVDTTPSVVPVPVSAVVPTPEVLVPLVLLPVVALSEVALSEVVPVVGVVVLPLALSEAEPSLVLEVGALPPELDEPGSPVLGPVLVLPPSLALPVALSTVSSPQAPRPSRREDAKIHGEAG